MDKYFHALGEKTVRLMEVSDFEVDFAFRRMVFNAEVEPLCASVCVDIVLHQENIIFWTAFEHH